MKFENECIKAYAAYAIDNEVVEKCSSGGIAFIFAKQVIEDGGVVAGVAFDDDFMPQHILIDEKSQIYKIRGSKYVHSKYNGIFIKVGDCLSGNQTVLFTGTPCQIVGLTNYLTIKNISQKKLITQDIICHGTVIPYIWEKYLEEKRREYSSDILSVSFRSKRIGWYDFGIEIEFKNGEVYFERRDRDVYMQVFLRDLALREECYNCRFRGLNRQSDVTLADFWSVYRNVPEAMNPRGTSLVLINSKKGNDLFHTIEKKIVSKQANISQVIRCETALCMSPELPMTRKIFLESVKKNSLAKSLRKYSNYRIGVFGSFNVRSIANRCGELKYHISNSSIISLNAEPCNIVDIPKGNNLYRNEMLINDFKKSVMLDISYYFDEIDFIIIDFLEERFGTLNNRTMSITNSEALNDTSFEKKDWKHNSILDKGYLISWKQAIDNLGLRLKKYINYKPIVLIKTRLATKKSDGNLYDNIELIEKYNDVLNQMYEYFLEKMKTSGNEDVLIIEVPTVFQYTQINHKYGCLPENLNSRAELYCQTIIKKNQMDCKIF